jgi:hypothetical protein
MERMTLPVRQTRMMTPRPRRGPGRLPGVLGVLGSGLLLAALAGCGSAVASSGAAAEPAATPSGAPQVGCASVNQATAVSIRREIRLMAPVGTNPISGTYRQTAQVRALFGQLCAAVTHPAPTQLVHCPADIGTDYIGTFYDGARVLATFTYAASGCERVSVTAAGKTLATMVYGPAAAAAPQLATDLAAIVGAPKPGVMQPQGGAGHTS